MFTLYVVATPIGNLEDISLRALRILREAGLIAAEDTRTTRRLLNHYGIRTPLTSYHEHNKEKKLPHILRCLEEKDVALVSNAGTPGVSDPGYALITAAIEQNIRVTPVPGAAAPVAAITAAGLPVNQVTFMGFLPRRKAARRKLLQSMASERPTLVAFESPHRLRGTLRDIADILGNRRLAACREMTKIHEEIFRGTAEQALQHFTQPRGEFTLVIEGKLEEDRPEFTAEVEDELRRLRRQGVPAREATRRISEITGLPRRELYQRWLKL